MNLEEIIGLLAGVFTTIAVLPQIIKAVRTKKAGDVSPLMYITLCLGVGLWTYYGVLKSDLPIILTNGISFILNSIMLFLALTQNRATNK